MFKRKQVVDCMERIAKLPDVEVVPTIGSVEIYTYRNKMEYSFHADGEESFTLGLHRRGRFDQVFDLDFCHLQAPPSSAVVAWVREYVKRNNIPVYDVVNHTGYMRFLVLRMAKRTGHFMVNVVTNYGDFPDRERFVAELTERFPEVTTIVHNQNGQKSNIATGEIEHILYGPGFIEEKLFERRFRIRANSFFQTNSIQTETLYRVAFNFLEPQNDDTVLDLYCGTGSIGILISEFVERVVGVELVEDAIRAARENAAINDLHNVEFYHGDVKDYLRSESAQASAFSIVIVDPPRAGLHPKALKRIRELTPRRLLYISCNPATFARDAADLAASGYSLKSIQPVDMFPHTMHIELVSLFLRND
jgi:23S rRNA (uracil1939-C5)-methyltransferase